jgi:hypothetical protein
MQIKTGSPERYRAFLMYANDWLASTAIDLMTAAEERGYLRLLQRLGRLGLVRRRLVMRRVGDRSRITKRIVVVELKAPG